VAALDRGHSAKGRKDLRDIAKLLILMREPRREVVAHLLTPEMREVIDRVGMETCLELAQGNVPLARSFHEQLTRNRTTLWTIQQQQAAPLEPAEQHSATVMARQISSIRR
jgi:hypothetical protein